MFDSPDPIDVDLPLITLRLAWRGLTRCVLHLDSKFFSELDDSSARFLPCGDLGDLGAFVVDMN